MAVQTTAVVPSLNSEPDAGEQITPTGGVPSVVVGKAKLTGADGPVIVTDNEAPQMICGGALPTPPGPVGVFLCPQLAEQTNSSAAVRKRRDVFREFPATG